MIIAAIDASPKSSGLIKFELDSNLNVIKTSRMGFKAISKKSKEEYKDIHTYNKDMCVYSRFEFMLPKIFEFISDCEYLAIEDFAYSASGSSLTMIAEFAGNIKYYAYTNNIKMRLYDPNTNKYLATGIGSAKKPDMYDSYISEEFSKEKIDISDLPPIPVFGKGSKAGERDEKGISPTSDIVDAWFLCKTLHLELQLRHGKILLSDLSEKYLTVFNRVTKAFPENILVRPFIGK